MDFIGPMAMNGGAGAVPFVLSGDFYSDSDGWTIVTPTAAEWRDSQRAIWLTNWNGAITFSFPGAMLSKLRITVSMDGYGMQGQGQVDVSRRIGSGNWSTAIRYTLTRNPDLTRFSYSFTSETDEIVTVRLLYAGTWILLDNWEIKGELL
jgi:hypothetical protein